MEQIKTNRLILRPFGGADIPFISKASEALQ
jgi:hypothetical protein